MSQKNNIFITRQSSSKNSIFLTRQDSNTSQQKTLSNAGNEIIKLADNQQNEFNKSMSQLKINQSQNIQQYINDLMLEQENYDKINELELKLMEYRSELRISQRDIESLKSAQKLQQFIFEAEIKKLNTNVNLSISLLKNKMERVIGESNAYNNSIQLQCTYEQKEIESIKFFIAKMKNRIEQLERDIGI